jgi:hypothetical protein
VIGWRFVATFVAVGFGIGAVGVLLFYALFIIGIIWASS